MEERCAATAQGLLAIRRLMQHGIQTTRVSVRTSMPWHPAEQPVRFGLVQLMRRRPCCAPAVVVNGVSTGLDIGLSNYSLMLITLSFYTMCKSTTPVFLLMFAFIWGIERWAAPLTACAGCSLPAQLPRASTFAAAVSAMVASHCGLQRAMLTVVQPSSAALKRPTVLCARRRPSWSLAGVVLVICAGLLLLVAGETRFDLVGFLVVMGASMLAGFRWTITQVLLQGDAKGHTSAHPAPGPVMSLSWSDASRCPCASASAPTDLPVQSHFSTSGLLYRCWWPHPGAVSPDARCAHSSQHCAHSCVVMVVHRPSAGRSSLSCETNKWRWPCSDVGDGAADVAAGGAVVGGAAKVALLRFSTQPPAHFRHHDVWRRHCIFHGVAPPCPLPQCASDFTALWRHVHLQLL